MSSVHPDGGAAGTSDRAAPFHLQEIDRQTTIHFCGLGGTGMSGLARMLLDMGYRISGSDLNRTDLLDYLASLGIRVSVPQNAANLLSDTGLMVVSAAIEDKNPEIMAARARNIPVVKYAAMLGGLMDVKRGIAVAGTHGKTTTTAMISWCMHQAGMSPSFVIGGIVPQLGGGSGVGQGDVLVAEACEYDRSFLNLRPECAVINNIEEDHLDYFENLEEICGAFRDFAKNVPADGVLCVSGHSPNIRKALRNIRRKKITYSVDGTADIEARNPEFGPHGVTYQLYISGRKARKVRLAVLGMHNVIDSLAAIAVCHHFGVKITDVIDALGEFQGIQRRFERLLESPELTVIDDYAHHPTEIRTVLKYARIAFPSRRIVVVFQPHQHSRTRFLLRDFSRSFYEADVVIVPDIYFVRDSDMDRSMVHARNLVEEIILRGGHASYIPSFEEIQIFLRNNMVPGDVIITMGAGNVCEVARNLVSYKSSRLNSAA